MAIHEKQNLFAKGSPTRKDSLRPEGDVAQATEGGWLSTKQTERFYRCRLSEKLLLVQPLRHPFGMPPLLVGEALAIHEKQNLFAKGSPTRGAGERQRD